MMNLLLLLAVAVLFRGVQTFVPGRDQDPASSTALAFGAVLLVAFLAGRLVEKARMPRVTGYLLTGIVAGPFVFKLLTPRMVESLGLVNGVAICLIALTAGGELCFRRMKPLLKVITSMTIWAVLGTVLLLTATTMALKPLLGFLAPLSWGEALAISTVLGVTLAAQSPAVVMALLEETRSDGPLSQTMLALVVLSDLLIIVLYALAAAGADLVLGGSADPTRKLLGVAWELFGSMGVGILVGIVLAIWLKKVSKGSSLFVLLVCVAIAEVSRLLHLDALIVALAAGLFIENVTEVEASDLIHAIESASLPVYVVFFAVAGAMLRLDLMPAVAIPAAILTVVRGFGYWAGARYAGKRSGAPAEVTRYTWVGLLPQAGLALALALLIERTFPTFGKEAGVLILAIVGINQLVPPILLRFAFVKSGEAGKKHASDFAGEETDSDATNEVAKDSLKLQAQGDST